MSLDETLLAIKREYSKDEKFKLFLQHLDKVELILSQERTKVLKLLREKQELEKQIESLTEEVGEYKGGDPKKYITVKAFVKQQKKTNLWEKSFWELHKKYESLKQTFDKTEVIN